jgi:hypothetical protein
MQVILNHLVSSQHLNLRFSWRQGVYCFLGVVHLLYQHFRRIVCLQNNKSDYIASHPRDDLFRAQT